MIRNDRWNTDSIVTNLLPVSLTLSLLELVQQPKFFGLSFNIGFEIKNGYKTFIFQKASISSQYVLHMHIYYDLYYRNNP